MRLHSRVLEKSLVEDILIQCYHTHSIQIHIFILYVEKKSIEFEPFTSLSFYIFSIIIIFLMLEAVS